MKIGFDVISDLYLRPDDSFNWEGKATSLYCIVAGNISKDLRTIRQTLAHLGRFYQGVFYCLGALEYEDCENIETRTKEIFKICTTLRNTALLHQHVVIIDSIAIVGVNGWYGNTLPADLVTEAKIETHRHEDIIYLKNSIEKLQRHLDVKKIVVVSNSVPGPELYFGQEPEHAQGQIPIFIALEADTEKKVCHWAYGTYDKPVELTLNSVTYVNNSSYKKNPYWSKRIEV
jgi:hypothetical protein